MAHTHQLEILRGLIKFKSVTQKIWGVLILLSIITTVEVVLGIYKPESLMVKFFRDENSKLDFHHFNYLQKPIISLGILCT